MIQGERLTLEDVGNWGSGGTPSRSKPEYYGGDIPWLIIEDLNDGIVSSAKEKITFKGLANSSAKLLDPGTLLIAMYGSIGKLGITNIQCATNQAIAFCKVNSNVADTKFLFYYLMHIRPQLVGEGRGGTQQNINQTILKEVPITLPSVPEQRAIAQRLERADRLRRLRQHALTTGDQYLQNVFLDMFGDPETNPRGWEISTLDDMNADFRYGTSKKSDYNPVGVPVLRIPNVLNRQIDLSDLKYSQLEAGEERRLTLQKGDILFVRTNGNPDYVGRCTVFDADDKFVYASYLIRARISPEEINPWFLEAFLQHQEGRKKMLPFIRTTAGQSNISVEGLGQIPVPRPPLNLQQQYALVVQKHERLRRMQVEALRQAEQLYETLLDEAFGD